MKRIYRHRRWSCVFVCVCFSFCLARFSLQKLDGDDGL